ncbi:hypothetical protein C6P45_001904 [Maudiozyma exigua]|uniref:Uncharacterized protein n=1 Tax=Maudiozyma exigua TaxID=34358 RepID=A0A9P6W0T6_MAUEX|nr:hypothetical protein C6P45_001904 [Kazachstania exigua]
MPSVVELLRISEECRNQAHLNVGKINDEAQVQQYYTLINTSIQALVDIKNNYSLTIIQDAEVTFLLVGLLLEETRDCELAETYLSSLRQRLQNYKNGSDHTYMQYWLRVEFIALYDVSIKRNSKFQYRVALNNCTDLIQYLQSISKDNDQIQEWCQMFQLTEIWLCIALNRSKKTMELWGVLLEDSKNLRNDKWNGLVMIYYADWLLKQKQTIPDEIITLLAEGYTAETIGPELYVIKLLLLLIDKIVKDENITDILTRFKEFFEVYKEQLNEESVITINFSEDVSIFFKHSTLFQYKNLKIVLLFFQSVSYLVNCYDDTANFSVKFLPRVKKNLIKELNNSNLSDSPMSVESRDDTQMWFTKLLRLTDFYKIWERLILKSHISERDLEKEPLYHDLFSIMHNQEISESQDDSDVAEQYYELSQITTSNEVKMISLMNSYIITVSKINQSDDRLRQSLVVKCENIWHEIENTKNNSGNVMWNCSIVVIWLISHLEPFTWTPLPTTDDVKSSYLNELQKYYENNRLINQNDNEQPDKPYKLKKGLLLQVMVNYLGGRLLETNLKKITEISNKCLQITKGQKMPYIRYVIGLWHLMNCTISMNSKEVIITKAKIESILKEM